jgi:hypothetical protein
MNIEKLLAAFFCLSLAFSAGVWAANKAMPTADLLQTPESATMIETFEVNFGTIGLYNCGNHKAADDKLLIVCYFVFTRTDNGQRDYDVEELTEWQLRLIDNFRVEHPLSELYLLNGRGQRQESVNLDTGDSAWFVAEFAEGAADINNARVVFIGLSGDPQVRAPVLPVE